MINQDTKAFKRMTKCPFCNQETNTTLLLRPDKFVSRVSCYSLSSLEFFRSMVRKTLTVLHFKNNTNSKALKIINSIKHYTKEGVDFEEYKQRFIDFVNKDIKQDASFSGNKFEILEHRMLLVEEYIKLYRGEVLLESGELANNKAKIHFLIDSLRNPCVENKQTLEFVPYSGLAKELNSILKFDEFTTKFRSTSSIKKSIFDVLGNVLVSREVIDQQKPKLLFYKGLWQNFLFASNNKVSTGSTHRKLLETLHLIKFGKRNDTMNRIFNVDELKIFNLNLNNVLIDIVFLVVKHNFRFDGPAVDIRGTDSRIIEEETSGANTEILTHTKQNEEVSINLHQKPSHPFTNKSEDSFVFIDWNALIEILLWIDRQNKERRFLHFEYALENIWRPIFQDFIHKDTQNTLSHAAQNKLELENFCEVSSLDLARYKDFSMDRVQEDPTLDLELDIYRNYPKLSIRTYIKTRESLLHDLYKSHIFQKCSGLNKTCQKRDEIFLCAFCDHYFCTDCKKDSIRK